MTIPSSIKGIFKITSADGNIVYYRGNQNSGAASQIHLSIPSYITKLLVNSMEYDVITGQFTGSLKSGCDMTLSLGPEAIFFNGSEYAPQSIILDNERFIVVYYSIPAGTVCLPK